jgi:hypothetical protein
MISDGTPKLVVALATFHQLQQNGHPFNARFRAAIQLVRNEHPFEIMMEEWRPTPEPSFASTLQSSTLKWENVGTPDEPQFKTWSRGLNCHPPDYDSSSPRMPEYGPLEVQERREAYMATRISESMKPYRTGLFIVGLGHLHSMLARVRIAGFDVKGYSWTGEL